jgi:hypothetical protein
LSIVCEGILPTLIRKPTNATINDLEKALSVAATHKCLVEKGIHHDRIKKKPPAAVGPALKILH